MTYVTVAGHRSMTLDDVRNDAYASALKEVIGPETVVLDLGAGTGIHGLIAARLGARRVYLVEPEDILSVAEEIVAANQLGDVVRCLHGRFEDVTLPERVDVIISVLTGNFLLTEDLLPTLFRARDTALKPDGVLIPSGASMLAVPVSTPDLHAKEIENWSTPRYRIDLSPARSYAANTVFYRWDRLGDLTYLAEPAVVHTLDFAHDAYEHIRAEVHFDITAPGICHGWVGWFDMRIGNQTLSTSPRSLETHWSPAFLPLDPPVAFDAGERVSFSLDRPPHGDWTWTMRSARTSQRHSTLLSAPMKLSTLRKAALDYVPSLNADGDELLEVLSACAEKMTAPAIAESLRERHPTRYASDADALRVAQAIVKRYA